MPKLTVISSNEAPTISDLAAIVAQLRPKIVFIDSFYMFQRRGPGANSQWEKTLGNVQDLKLKIANAFDVPVLASSQLRGAVDREILDANTDDAAYAKAIGDYADATRGLFGTADHVRDNQRLWRGLESREFQPVDLLINFNLKTMDFSEIRTIKCEEDLNGPSEEVDDDGKKKDDGDEILSI